MLSSYRPSLNFQNQRGNALFLILIAVALFAALAYAVTQSGRGNGGINKEQSALDASQMTQYGAEISQAIMRLMLSGGCTATSLSFDSAALEALGESVYVRDAYDIPNQAKDPCAIFYQSGAGVAYQFPPASVKAAGATEYIITGMMAVAGVGTTDLVGGNPSTAEILLVVKVPKTLCLAVNTANGITNPSGDAPTHLGGNGMFTFPPDNAHVYGWWWEPSEGGAGIGGFPPGIWDTIGQGNSGGTDTVLAGQSVGCYKEDAVSHEYYFYQVLLAR